MKKLKPWAARAKISAFRLYDRDIPEYPCIVDCYNDYFVVYDKSNPMIPRDQKHLLETLVELGQRFGVPEDRVILKKREQRDAKTDQYTKLSKTNKFIEVSETNLKFKVNLWDYLDTGLFLDHRPLRYKFAKGEANINSQADKKDQAMLNLFCYTGAVSVAAAKGGLKTTSVDMSRTYLEWAEENFKLNDLDPIQHQFIQADALQFLENPTVPPKSFDVIFLDPPTFSNSKRMQGDFDVERDQEFLVDQTIKLLKPDGVLYFSNNKRKFRLEPKLQAIYKIRDITAQTIPQDFHDQKIHHCFEIRK